MAKIEKVEPEVEIETIIEEVKSVDILEDTNTIEPFVEEWNRITINP